MPQDREPDFTPVKDGDNSSGLAVHKPSGLVMDTKTPLSDQGSPVTVRRSLRNPDFEVLDSKDIIDGDEITSRVTRAGTEIKHFEFMRVHKEKDGSRWEMILSPYRIQKGGSSGIAVPEFTPVGEINPGKGKSFVQQNQRDNTTRVWETGEIPLDNSWLPVVKFNYDNRQGRRIQFFVLLITSFKKG